MLIHPSIDFCIVRYEAIELHVIMCIEKTIGLIHMNNNLFVALATHLEERTNCSSGAGRNVCRPLDPEVLKVNMLSTFMVLVACPLVAGWGIVLQTIPQTNKKTGYIKK